MSKTLIVQLVLGLIIGGGIGALLGHFGKCSSGTCPLTANSYRGAMFGALLGVILSFSFVQNSVVSNYESEALIKIKSAADFEQQVIQSEQVVLVDFYSDSCYPCRKLGPIIGKLADQFAGRAVIAKVNVSELRDLTGRYQISGIPAVLFFVNGEEVKRIVGFNSQAVYEDQLKKLDSALN